ncbi:hypothetical protein VTN31DRAFT_5128 [Thermomyces dupontii]|uniref:uncharacterized protein n=1 Tax=Talaromyces thermophilus TaxID=28565 RepID=UPI003743729E
MYARPIAITALLASTALAATSISDEEMTSMLNAGGVELAVRYAPMWFFGQALNQPPCYPTWAFSGSPTTPDVYDLEHQTAPAPQCDYPDVGCDCRNPGVPINNPGPAFPIYFSYRKCNDNEVRVAYNLFYEKDGATVSISLGAIEQTGRQAKLEGNDLTVVDNSTVPHVVHFSVNSTVSPQSAAAKNIDIDIETGHNYDWERVIIVHSKDSNNNWTPTRALLSAHSYYHNLAWGDIQNTLTTEEINAGKAIDPNGVKNNDHPKVYVAWSKHAHFDTRNTFWKDPISQSLGHAFRSQDWWHFVDPSNYIRSDLSTTAGQALAAADWGDATANPPRVHDIMCDAS